MTEEIKLWDSEFGDDYNKRNSPMNDEFLRPRIMFWDNMIKNIYYVSRELPKDIIEIGANAGANLMAIRSAYIMGTNNKANDDDEDSEPQFIPHKLYATEVNADAAEALQQNVPGVKLLPFDRLHQFPNVADLAFTSGVLIHTHPAQRLALMRDIYNASRRYIVCIEYFAPETRMIPYRGKDNTLWLDDYGSLWLDNFGLRVISYGFCWKKVTGLDNVTYWVFEKVN